MALESAEAAGILCLPCRSPRGPPRWSSSPTSSIERAGKRMAAVYIPRRRLRLDGWLSIMILEARHRCALRPRATTRTPYRAPSMAWMHSGTLAPRAMASRSASKARSSRRSTRAASLTAQRAMLCCCSALRPFRARFIRRCRSKRSAVPPLTWSYSRPWTKTARSSGVEQVSAGGAQAAPPR